MRSPSSDRLRRWCLGGVRAVVLVPAVGAALLMIGGLCLVERLLGTGRRVV